MKAKRILKYKLVFFFLLLCILGWPQNVCSIQSSQRVEEKEPEVNSSQSKVSFAGYPVILYTPETSLIIGGGAVMTVRDEYNKKEGRPDNLNFYAIYTLKNQTAILFNLDFYFDKSKWQLKITSGYQKFPDLFYGIGNRTSKDNAEDITTEDFIIRPSFTRTIYKHLRMGITYHLNHTSVQEIEENGILDKGELVGSRGSFLSGFGPIVDWDSRDNIFYPSEGNWLQLYATFYKNWLGSEFDFQLYTLDFRHFLKIQERFILGLQVYFKSMNGVIPFNHLAKLDLLRGIHSSRFRDQNMAVVQVEHRYPIYNRLSGVVFAGVGNVMQQFSDFKLKESKFIIGAGLRFSILPSDKINIRLDIGLSRYGINPYFQLSEAF